MVYNTSVEHQQTDISSETLVLYVLETEAAVNTISLIACWTVALVGANHILTHCILGTLSATTHTFILV